ncbi:pimeloyl-ACP methyl ester esterase BioH [Candidatus Schneideria nysicola]|uniref:pimeloyl-ACP methyl ester esterase BioH n=1 Tax=Candidatus Schneideria nysicola TaxID=1081631 RepID=UPI001CAA6096|nr:pimeloyl-ACP methyl ester esterase BioH [Candidatus Schneideria nysicola]UAJ65450.1 pimeloyl-ACP methyl ester esterase BioH [Candidatus Schneideria nysicola]
MSLLRYKKIGNGNIKLVLLHGWGLDSKVWLPILKQLQSSFQLYLIDLPGYGINYNSSFLNLEKMIEEIIDIAPINALWLGWSLGGLIATKIAIQNKNVSGLITVASSPKFCSCEKGYWPGMNSKMLDHFAQQLKMNYLNTINRFIHSQIIMKKSVKYSKILEKNIVFTQKIPSSQTLDIGLNLLKSYDLRSILSKINLPILHIYGRLDNLVNYKIVSIVDTLSPNSTSIIFKRAFHAPFISHPNLFSRTIINFCRNID